MKNIQIATPKEDKAGKGKWMWRHKSLGVLTGIVVAPRLGYRLFNMGKVSDESRELRAEGEDFEKQDTIEHRPQ